MNNLATKTRFSLLVIYYQKLLFLPFIFSLSILSAQIDSVDCSAVSVSTFEYDLIDSLSMNSVNFYGKLDTLFFKDDTTSTQCFWQDFKDSFKYGEWDSFIDNNDGRVDTTDLPRSISLIGASHSPINNYKRYINKLQFTSPTDGYVSFEWKAEGGDYANIDAFYFTVNDSCKQLSYKNIIQGRFTSWFINRGDTISLEQASNGSANHISTTVSNFSMRSKRQQ